jgi:hypothetical protein
VNAPLATLFALALLIYGYGQTTNKVSEAEYERFFDSHRRLVEARGITNVYANMREDLVSCGLTNITEEDLRKNPTLYVKHMLRITFFSGLQQSAETRGVTKVYAELRTNLNAKGFTNITEEDLRRDPALYIVNMSRIHAALPASCLDWPPPETNRMDGVKKFIEQHGWAMPECSAWDVMTGRGTRPLTGLPWRAIADRTFPAYTAEGKLYVVLHGPTSFGPEQDGLVWSLHTNRLHLPNHTCKALGGRLARICVSRDRIWTLKPQKDI